MNGENGFVGMDPALAKSNIDDFKRAMLDVEDNFDSAVNTLFEELSYAWVSPNAVEFYTKYSEECYSLKKIMIESELAICQGAWRAYNTMANALGCATISEDYGYDANKSVSSGWLSISMLHDNKGGKSGMNVNLVKNFILPAFDIGVKRIEDSLTAVPTSIALYDAEGEQSGAYATGISNMKSKVENLLNDIKNSILNAIETETDNMLLAKQQSANAMNG